MLEINMEFRKGILFVRLIGILNKKTGQELNNCLSPIILDKGIRYLVLNLGEIKSANKIGIKSLERHINETKKNDGYTLICNSKIKNSKFKVIDNELTALKIINI